MTKNKKPRKTEKLIGQIQDRIDWEIDAKTDGAQVDAMCDEVAKALGQKFSEELHYQISLLIEAKVNIAFNLGWRYCRRPEDLIFDTGQESYDFSS